MRLLKCVLATGLCWGLSGASQVYAQRADDPIQLTADFNEAGDLVVKAEKRRLGTYSAAIDFQNVQNLTVPSRYRVAIRSSGPLIVLKAGDTLKARIADGKAFSCWETEAPNPIHHSFTGCRLARRGERPKSGSHKRINLYSSIPLPRKIGLHSVFF